MTDPATNEQARQTVTTEPAHTLAFNFNMLRTSFPKAVRLMDIKTSEGTRLDKVFLGPVEFDGDTWKNRRVEPNVTIAACVQNTTTTIVNATATFEVEDVPQIDYQSPVPAPNPTPPTLNNAAPIPANVANDSNTLQQQVAQNYPPPPPAPAYNPPVPAAPMMPQPVIQGPVPVGQFAVPQLAPPPPVLPPGTQYVQLVSGPGVPAPVPGAAPNFGGAIPQNPNSASVVTQGYPKGTGYNQVGGPGPQVVQSGSPYGFPQGTPGLHAPAPTGPVMAGPNDVVVMGARNTMLLIGQAAKGRVLGHGEIATAEYTLRQALERAPNTPLTPGANEVAVVLSRVRAERALRIVMNRDWEEVGIITDAFINAATT